ncbi:MAG: amidohydrolase family protein [Actinomycetota bacterium]|nr:amidohydrolase family protein [Acidimicrobiales bacterium]MEE2805900.1 amidohydrolase family protein [Actinomycetota bacterium]|tara:strand:- start:9074 stop:10747 length:1674 start_codon:yes stop_codon:yes gene_type:complete
MGYDLKITGGTIVDGTGASRYLGDLGIKDGRIVAMGDAPAEAQRSIDATGRIVAPGFVDIHTHYDAQVLWDPLVSCSPWHGVTTIVMGNCGFSVAPTRPEHRDLIMRTLENVEGMSVEALRAGLGDWGFETFPEYLDALDANGCAVNMAAMVGHTAVRMYVLGEEATEREATEGEIARQRELVTEALEAGALGFATSRASTHVGYEGRPVPSRLATSEEIIEIAQALGDVGGIMQATQGRGLSHDEFARVAETTGANVSWTALLASTLGPGSHLKDLEKAHALADRGLPVFPQVAVQPVQFEMSWKAPFIYEGMRVFQPVAQSDFEGRKAYYADRDWREQFKDKAGNGGKIGDRWARTEITWFPPDPSMEGKNVQVLADELGQDPVDVMLDMALDADLDMRIVQDVVNHDRDEIDELLHDPTTVIGLSDAGAHASQLCDAKYSTEFLSTFVRERESFDVEQAVHMLTQRPAQIFGIEDRGTLSDGGWADVVVFDMENVGHEGKRRVYDLPAGADRLISDATGIDAVVVNGTIIRQHGEDAVSAESSLPGKLLRHGRA